MGYSFEEIQALQKPQRESARQSHIEQLQARASVGQKISELQADPRWEVFGRHVNALRSTEFDRETSSQNRLINAILTSEDYLKVKIAQASSSAAVKAYDNVMNLAKTLIEQGESALKELNSLTSEEKSA